jgi:hypothetical protein
MIRLLRISKPVPSVHSTRRRRYPGRHLNSPIWLFLWRTAIAAVVSMLTLTTLKKSLQRYSSQNLFPAAVHHVDVWSKVPPCTLLCFYSTEECCNDRLNGRYASYRHNGSCSACCCGCTIRPPDCLSSFRRSSGTTSDTSVFTAAKEPQTSPCHVCSQGCSQGLAEPNHYLEWNVCEKGFPFQTLQVWIQEW